VWKWQDYQQEVWTAWYQAFPEFSQLLISPECNFDLLPLFTNIRSLPHLQMTYHFVIYMGVIVIVIMTSYEATKPIHETRWPWKIHCDAPGREIMDYNQAKRTRIHYFFLILLSFHSKINARGPELPHHISTITTLTYSRVCLFWLDLSCAFQEISSVWWWYKVTRPLASHGSQTLRISALLTTRLCVKASARVAANNRHLICHSASRSTISITSVALCKPL
jgi:hypothetical protein